MYGGLNVKGMSFLPEFSQKGNTTNTFAIISNIKFHGYLSDGSRLVSNVQRSRRTDRRKNVQTNLTKVVDILTYLLTQWSRVLL